MILGIGCDSIDILRIAKLFDRFPEKFMDKILCLHEKTALSPCGPRSALIHTLAKRFAAKEACFKAVGTGLRQGMSWHDVAIHHTPFGAPQLTLSGQTLRHAETLLAQQTEPSTDVTMTGTLLKPRLKTWVSISDTPHSAMAMVVLEAVFP